MSGGIRLSGRLARGASTALLVGAIVVAAAGAVTWERTVVDAAPGPDDERIEATYPFVVTGASAITVGEIASSCGCTAATLTKRRYAPGEAGIVTVVFSIGDRTGHQDKRVRVPITADGADAPEIVELAIRADIRAAAVLDRRLVRWEVGAEPVPQTVTFTVVQPDPLHVVAIDGYQHDDFKVATEAVADGRVYRVTITPTSTAGTRDTSIFLRTDHAVAQRRDYRIWLVIH